MEEAFDFREHLVKAIRRGAGDEARFSRSPVETAQVIAKNNSAHFAGFHFHFEGIIFHP